MPKNYIFDWRRHETAFDGEAVTMEIRPLKSWAMLELMPYLDEPKPRKEKESIEDYIKRLSPEDRRRQQKESQQVQALAERIFPEHVRNIEGFLIDGKAPTAKALAEETAFMDFTVGVIMALVSISSISREAEKNSGGPSATPASEKKKSDA